MGAREENVGISVAGMTGRHHKGEERGRSGRIAFPAEAKAEEVRRKLLGIQKEYLIELV